METSRLLAIDPSLTCSGWALFECSRNILIGVGKVRSLPADRPIAVRLSDLQSRITDLLDRIKLQTGDLVVCEAPTTMRDPSASFKVEQVRGLFETLARSRGATVPGRINPRSVHSDVMGLRGKQLPRAQIKSLALGVVVHAYRPALESLGLPTTLEELKSHQDIVDAVLVGNLATTWIKAAQLAGMSVEQYFDRGKARTTWRLGHSRAGKLNYE